MLDTQHLNRTSTPIVVLCTLLYNFHWILKVFIAFICIWHICYSVIIVTSNTNLKSDISPHTLQNSSMFVVATMATTVAIAVTIATLMYLAATLTAYKLRGYSLKEYFVVYFWKGLSGLLRYWNRQFVIDVVAVLRWKINYN